MKKLLYYGGMIFLGEGTDQAWYQTHLQALKEHAIISITIPTIQELRSWVSIMLWRSVASA